LPFPSSILRHGTHFQASSRFPTSKRVFENQSLISVKIHPFNQNQSFHQTHSCFPEYTQQSQMPIVADRGVDWRSRFTMSFETQPPSSSHFTSRFKSFSTDQHRR
jgi:hypothetical protein